MRAIKQFLIKLINIFFKFYFSLVGEQMISGNLEKTLKLYNKGGFSQFFNKIRIWDAPYDEIEKRVPKKGFVIDLGSGDGLLGNFLAVSSKKRKVLGIEINKERVKNSPRIENRTSFKVGNILEDNFPKANVITLIHVLHHLGSYADQETLIHKCKDKLKVGGVLVIAEIIEKPILKFIFTTITDYVILPILFENKLFSGKIYFRSLKTWQKLLKDSEFIISTKLISRDMPFSHVIFEAKLR